MSYIKLLEKPKPPIPPGPKYLTSREFENLPEGARFTNGYSAFTAESAPERFHQLYLISKDDKGNRVPCYFEDQKWRLA